MPIVSGAKAASTLSGSGGTLSQQAAAVADGTSGANVAMESLALLNASGTFDRARTVSTGSGEQLTYAPGIVDLLTKLVQLNMAILMTLAAVNHEHPTDPFDLLNQLDYLQASTL